MEGNPLRIYPDGNTEKAGYHMVSAILEHGEIPDALVCMNNFVAFGALKRLKEKGISVPQEIGIVTFDNEPLAPYTTPALTCLHMDTFGLGAGPRSYSCRKYKKKVKLIKTSFYNKNG